MIAAAFHNVKYFSKHFTIGCPLSDKIFNVVEQLPMCDQLY